MNGFEALRPLAADLKQKAKEREAHKEQAQKVQARIARDTQEFLDTMRKTGVKAAAGVKIAQHVEEKDIDFAAAMRKAGVSPLGVPERVQHKKSVRPEPRQTIADKFGAEAAENVSILYGGSCKPTNAKEIFAKPDVDGGLIGGAALKCADFKGIIDAWKA